MISSSPKAAPQDLPTLWRFEYRDKTWEAVHTASVDLPVPAPPLFLDEPLFRGPFFGLMLNIARTLLIFSISRWPSASVADFEDSATSRSDINTACFRELNYTRNHQQAFLFFGNPNDLEISRNSPWMKATISYPSERRPKVHKVLSRKAQCGHANRDVLL
jgi:hypothetical protein